MKKLAIVEDNLEFSRKLLNYILSKNSKVRITNILVNVEELLQTLETLNKGDILLLDLQIQGINTDELLNIFKQRKNNMPYIIVITNSEKQCEKLKEYICMSVKKTGSLNKIVNMIDKITYLEDDQLYEKLVKEELNKFEINVTTVGYDYIVDGIMLSLKDETLLKDMQNKLYKAIGEKNNLTNTKSIKWALEKCVKSTIRYTNADIVNPYFRVEVREKVTPKLFLSMVVYNLKTTIEEEMDA